MANFNKAALKYTYYWTVSCKSKRYLYLSDEDIIDRRNGFHMLDFVNRFLTLHGLFSFEYFRKVEFMICRYMPLNLETRGEMNDWLRKNWNTRFGTGYNTRY